MATTSKYTYKQFGLDIIALAKGELELTPEVSIRLMEKAQALVNAQESKAAYNATHPKKSTAKGASAATMEKANAIKSVLTASPMTAAEINAALGTDYTALQVANAVKYIDGVTSEKVVRTVTNSKGLTSQKEYTGYKVG
ncbi:MAG TPA: hypothetical protein [Caudoviricetes sp.]|jgi:hypothetical protein|nr:MAG TPA: hypothetical protein [Caudoviricetes sp.]